MAGAGNGNAKNGPRNNGGGAGPRRFTVSLSLPGAVVAAAVLVFGLAWTFVLGVLVGRGYSPESALPEIAALMPGAANASRGEVQVLRPEDLHYLDDLTRKPAAPPASLTAREPARPRPPDKAADKAGNRTVAPPPPAAAAAASAPLDAEPGGRVYRYVYQVAAFPDPASAQASKARLEGAGLNAGVEKYVDDSQRAWHRVMVYFQGSPEDTRDLKDRLAGLGISRVIMRDKKPL